MITPYRFALSSLLLLLSACGGGSSSSSNNSSADMPNDQTTEQPTVTVASLSQLASFPIGAAVPAGNAHNSLFSRSSLQAVVQQHFNALTAENIMKPEFLHPTENSFFFTDADQLLTYAQANGLGLHGHVLIWHSQLPQWIPSFTGDWSTMMNNHIQTIVSHYAGDINSWDVVNEAFDDNIPTGYRNSVWLQNIGQTYIEDAFTAARAADPNADLYYNDYNISGIPEKLSAVLTMLDDFQARGIPIDGIGFQMHIEQTWPDINTIRNAFSAVASRGVKVKISELDISLNANEAYTSLSDELALLQQARYRDIVSTYIEAIPAAQRGGITVWGVSDADSWIPFFYNRLDWPLLFDEQLQAKPALQGFADGLQN